MADDKKTLELQIRIAAGEAFAAVSQLKGEMQHLSGEFKRFSDVDGASASGAFRNAKEAADKAAASFKLFGESGNELRSVQMQLKTAAVDLAAKGIDPQNEEIQKLVEEYKRLGKEADELDKAAGQNIDSFDKLKNSLTSLAEVAVFAKFLGELKNFGAFALSTADTFQTMRNEFGILLGDMEAGAGLFNQIKAFNDKTPFAMETLTQATNVLLAAKVPLADMEAQLARFGDLAQGNSQRFSSYIHAFSMAAAKGKADMMVLNTYLNQGVPILDALAERFHVTAAEVMEMSSQGKISFEDFSAALDGLTAAGGRYFGGMELGSRSLAAMQEGLKESVNSLAASFGDMLLPAAIRVVDALTWLTNAINDSPIAKGVLTGALVMLTGNLAKMALQAAVAFANQMGLNLAIGALNPVVMAATLTVAALAAGYVIYASELQNAKREQEDFALALKATAAAAKDYADAFSRMSAAEIGASFEDSRRAVTSLERHLLSAQQRLEQLQNAPFTADMETGRINREEIKKMEAAVKDLENRLELARKDLDAKREGREAARNAAPEAEIALPNVNVNNSAADAARAWRERWNEEWKRYQNELAIDPFAGIETDRAKKLIEAEINVTNKEELEQTIGQINEYYNAKRSEAAGSLKDEEERIMRDLTKTRVDNIAYEMRKELEAIDLLEQKRIFAAGESEEEIAAIRKTFADIRLQTAEQYEKEIAQTKLDEARAGVKDWQQELSDALTRWLLDLNKFSDEAAAILGDLSARFTELAASSALGGFEEFGRALGEGKDAAESFEQALAAMAQQILKQLPAMFLQAGLQLIANGQWALGLGFIAAAGSSAFISGLVDGKTAQAQKAAENARGSAYDEYGKAARAFAAGGTFTNQVVNQPTHFRYGGSLGVMGEAGPEAVVPLKRMPGGNLGVETRGSGGASVVVNIINNTNAEARQEEHTDSEGNTQIDIVIGRLVDSHIASGKADRAMGARYGIHPAGV
jgi:tape measure domain-containing protein